MSTQPIICRSCNTAAQVVIENNEPKDVTCPRCGASEKYADTVQMLQTEVHKKVQDMFRNAFKGNKSITYRPGRIPNPNSRFRLGS